MTTINDADADMLTVMYTFANKYKDNIVAADVLMSFCAGECLHFGTGDTCELCGEKFVRRKLFDK